MAEVEAEARDAARREIKRLHAVIRERESEIAALSAALKLCKPFCKGHQETPEKVARYQQVAAAIANAGG